MHTSLDQALGRNPRLNRVGQSLLNIASGASAAYSLRSLTGGDPNVVRVRRDSDNAERDFTASEVSSGELTNWVNSQTTLPLDLRTLQADGRTGAVIDAKAAYSLRNLSSSYTGNVVQVRRNVDGSERDFTAAEVSDGTLTTWVNESFNDALPLDTSSGASAAYSLRNLSSSYSGNVVEVRRSSDDTERDFTASEVSDGTLTDWVNTEVAGYTSDFSSSTDGWISGAATLTNVDADADGSGNPPSNDWLRIFENGATGSFSPSTSSYQLTAGLSYKLTAQVYRPTGSGFSTIKFRSVNWATGWDEVSLSEGLNEVSLPATVVGGSGTSNLQITLTSTSAGDTLYLKNIVATQTTADGHVKTWYDQSGNSNNATQTTAGNQPKIVDGGSLVQRNGNPAVQSTSSDNLKFTLDSLSANGHQSVFAVLENDVTSQDGYGAVFRATSTSSGTGGENRRPWWFGNPTGGLVFTVDSTTGYTNSDRDYRLYSHIMNGTAGGTSTIHRDGTQVDTRSITLDENSTFKTSDDPGVLAGVTDNATGALYMSEVIYYPSGQATKRRALEENIANHYGITLSSFSRDGFVKTWYDQSSTTGTANNNHATQSDSSKQPKIVNAGTYLDEIDFDGTDDYLDLTSAIGATTESAVFTVAESGGGNDKMILDNRDSAVDGYRVFRLGNAFEHRWSSAIVDTGTNPGTDTKFIGFANHSGSAATAGVNGAAVTSVSDSSTLSVTNAPRIGARSFSTPTTFWDGTMNELIIYTTDQTDNRTALEANIGEHYSISGIPAYDNTVNGFVEAFYDQSGNGNDATQTTAGSQPKIVNAGTQLDHLLFDGTDDVLLMDSALDLDPFSVLAVGPLQGATSPRLVGRQSSSNNGILIAAFSSNSIRLVSPTGTLTFSDGVTRTAGDVVLASMFFGAGDTLTAFVDGATQSLSGTPDSNTALDIDQIGARQALGFMSGKLKELVIYPTDVSSNREALESNIAAANGITLS